MIANAGAQVRIVGRIHGQETNNVLNFGTETPWNVDTVVPDLQQLANAVLQCVVQGLLPAITSDWHVEKVTAKHIYPQKTDEIEVAAPANSVGQLGPASHSFACTLVHIKTGGGGRSGRGRFFLPPPGEAQTQNSLIDGPTLALIAAFVACMSGKFIGAGASTDWRIGVFSRKIFGGLFANFNNAFREATVLIPTDVVAIMGTRKINRGS